jgi:cytochrome P450
MAFHHLLDTIFTHPYLFILLAPVLALLIRSLYRPSSLHPLSHIPSSPFYPLTSLILAYHAYIGNESTAIHALHRKYGSIVRTGPNSVDIADGEALYPIYVEKGGFMKPHFYGNFNIDGHKSIFSEIDPASRAPRAKAVVGLFSTSSLRAGRDVIDGCIDEFVARLKREAATGNKVNVLNLTRSMALDVVTAYLFGKSYGGLGEEGLSAAGMVDSFVAVGRFWYLPTWAFSILLELSEKFWPDEHVSKSLDKVDKYVKRTVESIISEKAIGNGIYPARLLEAGFSESETKAQCKDVIFAGTDSTGMNLTTIMFFLAKQPATYAKLREEVLNIKPGSDEDLQALPYLRSVVKEGLRISLANPSRLPRIVPPTGWTFKGVYIPPGTEVSCTPFDLHLNENVFTDALAFRPERWLNPTDEMNRDWIPFGLGTRQCIARNLAMVELYIAVYKLALEDVMNGARCCQEKIKILEWFNSKVIGKKVEFVWDQH